MVNAPVPPAPTSDYLALVHAPTPQLAKLMSRGEAPDVAALVGWEWRGTNLPATSRLLGLRRFIKGFVPVAEHARSLQAEGYNVTVPGHDLATPWTDSRRRDGRREWARFTVTPVDPAAADNRFLNALLIDYSTPPASERGLPRLLRDYLVRVVPGSDALLLGQAFFALGDRRIPLGWFALEPLRAIRTSRSD
jgi:hypothetical protein